MDDAYQKYNEEQYTTVKLPGSNETVRIPYDDEEAHSDLEGRR